MPCAGMFSSESPLFGSMAGVAPLGLRGTRRCANGQMQSEHLGGGILQEHDGMSGWVRACPQH